MKRFRFSLQTVLNVRRQNEELRQRELAGAQAKRDHLFMRLGKNQNELKGLVAEQSGSRGGRIDLNMEAWYGTRRRALAQTIQTLQWHLAASEKELDEARARAVEAARERRVLEKLEEDQRNEWLKKLNTEEQGLLDELAQRSVPSFSFPSASAEPA